MVAVLAVASCGGGTKTVTVQTPSTPTASSSTGSSAAATSPTSAQTTNAAAPSQVLGETKSNLGATIQVNALKRTSSSIVELDFTMTNTTSDNIDATSMGNERDVGAISLVDETAQKRYLTIFDTNQVCLCTNNLVDDTPGFGANTTGHFYADFPAPPSSVTSIDVVFPTAAPVHNVPISG